MESDTPAGRPRPVYRNFIFEPRRRFLFAYVPKVGCTNWKSVLRHLAGHDDYLNPRLAHDRANGGLRYLDLSEGPDRALLRNPEVPKYAFVRDPYSRTLSAYLNKIASRLPLQPASDTDDHFTRVTRAIDGFRQRKLDTAAHPEVSFEVFLLWLRASLSPWCDDEHWQKQSALLRWRGVEYSFVGRFERLAEEAPLLLEKMGATIPFPSQRDVKFAPTNATDRQDAFYTPRARRLVNKLYAPDFANFGYEMHED